MAPTQPSKRLDDHLLEFLSSRYRSSAPDRAAIEAAWRALEHGLYQAPPDAIESAAVASGVEARLYTAIAARIGRAVTASTVAMVGDRGSKSVVVQLRLERGVFGSSSAPPGHDLLILAWDREQSDLADSQAGTVALLEPTPDGPGEEDTPASTLEAGAPEPTRPRAGNADGETLVSGHPERLAIGPELDRLLQPIRRVLGGERLETDDQHAPVAVVNEIEVGDTLDGKYSLREKLGQGGFGSVYRARDKDLDTEVAVKILRSDLAAQEGAIDEFRSEARRVAKLEHPNIVGWKGFSAGSDAGPYFVMEFIRGQELVRVLREEGGLELGRAKTVLRQILAGLVAAHFPASGEQVLHLDLKPGNVLLARDSRGREQAKVIDFGIGRLTGRGGERTGGATRFTTHTGLPVPGATISVASERSSDSTSRVACTPEYASPEQAENFLESAEVNDLDDRSDLYSFGVLAFEVLTGQLPYKLPRHASRIEFLELHREAEPRRVRDLRPEVDKRLAAFVARCLAKDPNDRFDSTREALSELEAITAPRRKPVAVAVGLLGAVGMASVYFFGPKVDASGPFGLERVIGDAREPIGSALVVASGDEVELAVIGNLSVAGQTLDLVRASDRRRVPGFSVWEADGEAGTIVVRSPSGVDGVRTEQLALLVGEGASQRESGTVEVLTVGDAAVRSDGVTLGGAALGAEGLSLCPRDVALEARVLVTGDVDYRLLVEDLRVTVERGNESWTRELGAPNAADGVLTYRVGLESLVEGPGTYELSIDLEGAAGLDRDFGELGPLTVVSPAPRIEAPALTGVARRGTAWLLEPVSEPGLRFEVADRGTETLELVLSVERESESEPVWSTRTTCVAGQPLDLPLPVEHLHRADEPTMAHSGLIRIRVEDADSILHVDPSLTGFAEATLAYVFEPERPQVAASFAGRAVTEGGRTLMAQRPTLEVQRVGGSDAIVRIAVLSGAGGGGAAVEPIAELPEVALTSAYPQAVPLDLPAPGEYVVRVETFRASHPDELVEPVDLPLVWWPEVAEVELEFEDGRPAGTRVRPDDPIPVPRVAVRADSAAYANLKGTLVVRSEAPDAPFTIDLDVGPEGPRAVPLGSVADLADGDVELLFALRDPLGRESQTRTIGFELARRPPRVQLQPLDRGARDSWIARGDRYLVQVVLHDLNGIAEAPTVTLEAVGPDAPDRRTEALTTQSDADPGGLYQCSFDLDDSWSERAVRLSVDVADEAGNRRNETLLGPEDLILGEILPRLPSRVLVADAAGEFGSTPMVLVRGLGDESNYTFGEDKFENTEPIDLRLDGDLLEPYFLDQHEVTVGQFAHFVEHELGFADPDRWPAGAPSAGRREQLLELMGALDPRSIMVGVTWDEAAAYADFAGKRLQSWLEWEWATRGGSAGGRWSGEQAGVQWDAVAEGLQYHWMPTLSVDDYLDVTAHGGAGLGVRGLCSGAWEWTATPALDGQPWSATAGQAAIVAPWGGEAAPRYVVVRGNDGGQSGPGAAAFHIVTTRARDYATRRQIGFRCSLSFERYRELREGQRTRP